MRILMIFAFHFVVFFSQTGFAGWTPWTNMGGSYTWDPALCTEFFTFNKAHVVARGADGAIWIRTWYGQNWGPAVSLGGYFSSSPGIACSADRIDVFARGYDGNIRYRTYYYSDRTWHPWRMITVGTVASGPSAIYRGGNSLTVYARLANGSLASTTSAFDKWSSWQVVPGNFQGEPSATTMFFPRFQFSRIIIRGADNYIWELLGTKPDGSPNWARYPVRLYASPEVALSRQSSLGYYFVRNGNSTISWSTNPGGWGDAWKNLGGSIASGPAAVWYADNKLLLIGRASNGNLHYRIYTP